VSEGRKYTTGPGRQLKKLAETPLNHPEWLNSETPTDRRVAFYLSESLRGDKPPELLLAFLRLAVIEGWI